MGYLLYSLSFILLIISTALYLTRSFWLSLLTTMNFPGSSYLYARLPSSFASDMENGFSSPAFDLSGNVSAGDSRAGLDDSSKKEIQKIMKKRRVNFDEARRIYTEGRFAKNGIAPDGLPRDPKFVSFS